ncbi:MAG TPA: enoyl-CoA hydratase/isomerase family protein [Xanthobacteraceae bacterium]|nr:enoyl-CoA hydratase/isomerase family protein [Xanthobacteraceae bacterium]
MAILSDYANKYSCIKMERHDGVLQVTLHTDGGSLKWGLTPHRELPLAFYDIANDHDTKVVILTGSGEEFSGPRVTHAGHPLFPTRPSMEVVDALVSEGKQGLMNFLNIDVPVISAINGPAWRHSELPLLADIVLAADTAAFQDSAHFTGGLVPGDGMHVVYPLLLGVNRARYFLLTGETLDARQAHALGLVAEVMPKEKLMGRAWQLAGDMAKRPKSLLRLSRAVLTEHIKRHMQDYLGFGLYVEMLALMDRPA